jgi:hypothetical protein
LRSPQEGLGFSFGAWTSFLEAIDEKKLFFKVPISSNFYQCCGSGMFVPNFFLPISDLVSRIQKPQQKKGEKNLLSYLFCSHKFHKIEKYFIFEMLKKKFGPVFKELLNFLPKYLSLSCKKYGFGIRDP